MIDFDAEQRKHDEWNRERFRTITVMLRDGSLVKMTNEEFSRGPEAVELLGQMRKITDNDNTKK